MPCGQEDPIYKTYKHQYFGYHPTCWRQFPAGWGCPSPAGPDREASFKKYPFAGGMGGASRPPGEGEEGTEGAASGNHAGQAATSGCKPFTIRKRTNRRCPRQLRGRQTPSPTNPEDPFELDSKTPPGAPRSGQPGSGGPGAASNGPELPPGRSAWRTGSPHDPERILQHAD